MIYERRPNDTHYACSWHPVDISVYVDGMESSGSIYKTFMNNKFEQWWDETRKTSGIGYDLMSRKDACQYAWNDGYESGFYAALKQVRDDAEPNFPEFIPLTLLEKLHP